MAMINYTNKVPLNTNGGVADINKCNAIDLNEIKNAFNIQVAQGWYNIGVTALLTLTYVSFNSTTKIGVIASNLDLTPFLSVGMKFKFTQNSAVKYGIITAISSTQITLFMGNNFTLNNSGISNPFYSMLETPYDFPQSIYSLVDNLEVPTKDYYNNKIIYAKKITITNGVPGQQTKSVPHNITNYDHIWVDPSNSYARSADGTISYTLPLVLYSTYSNAESVQPYIDGSNLNVIPVGGWSNGWVFYITLKYTKN